MLLVPYYIFSHPLMNYWHCLIVPDIIIPMQYHMLQILPYKLTFFANKFSINSGNVLFLLCFIVM